MTGSFKQMHNIRCSLFIYVSQIREWLEHHRSQKSRPDGKLPRDNWDYWFISEVAAGDLLHELIMVSKNKIIV